MTVRSRAIDARIGALRRVSLAPSVIEAARARPGSGLIVEVIRDGVIELRVRPERTLDELQRDFALTVPIDNLEVSLHEEERRLASELR